MSIGLYRIGYILRGWTSRVTKGYKVEPPEIMTSPPLECSGSSKRDAFLPGAAGSKLQAASLTCW